jgi:uncharacterized membrane protein (UPF0127 family)
MPLRLLNRRTGHVLADAVEIAATRRTRRRGLLGRDSLDPSAAIVLTPCCSIHTAFMRFAIDVVFIDRDGCVVRIVSKLPPWRAAWAVRAHAVVELAGDRLLPDELRVGDSIYLVPAEPGVGEPGRSSASSSLRMTAANPARSGSHIPHSS